MEINLLGAEMKSLNFLTVLTSAIGAIACSANAGTAPYPRPSIYNPDTYTFTAVARGHVIAYFAGQAASHTETVGMKVNGVQTPEGFGLSNKTSSLGDQFNLGFANARDAIILDMYDASVSSDPYVIVYSTSSLNYAFDNQYVPNSGRATSIHYTTVTAGQINSIPAGTYIGLDDPDFGVVHPSYANIAFVIATGIDVVQSGPPIPEPSTWALMITGLSIGGAAMRLKRRRKTLAVV